MKYCVIVPDGMADDPRSELGGKTPIEAARIPHLRRIAREGRLGQVRLIPRGMAPGSDVANLALLGYDPSQYYTGRAPLEAASLGIELGRADWALRCNFVTVSDGKMVDYSAGHISSKEAAVIMEFLNDRLGSPDAAFHAGVSYRNLLVLRNRPELDVRTVPPHDITGRAIEEYFPTGKDGALLRKLMEDSVALLAEHEVNNVRLELGENPATMIWLWGQGTAPDLPPFAKRFGVKAALISAVDLLRGLGLSLKMDVITVPGATGYFDTDYAAKGRSACDAFETHDFVMVHVEAPDEAGHEGDLRQKLLAIEAVDDKVTGPVLKRLEEKGEPFRIMVLPDHATPLAVKTHTDVPVPFAMYGDGVSSPREVDFSERAAAQSDLKIDPGYELMGYFITLPGEGVQVRR